MNSWTESHLLLQNSPGSAVVDFHHFQWPYGVLSHPRTHGDVSGKANKETSERVQFTVTIDGFGLANESTRRGEKA